MPGPGTLITPSPDTELMPVSPAPSSGSGASPGGVQGSTPKSGSQAFNQPRRSRDGTSIAQRSPVNRNATPEPASRPASGAAPSGTASGSSRSGNSAANTGADDPLIDLPPLATPVDRRGAANEPVAVEADKIAKTSGEATAPRPASEPQSSAAPAGRPASAELPPRAIDTGFTPAPGIKRFKAVEPQLSGGSLPTPAGWTWLAETSYKTLLDLRDPSEDRQSVVAIAAAKAFRYVSLPVSTENLNADLLKRFLDELAMTGGRPLYFFDTDGTRAATLWYLKLVAVDRIDNVSARKSVEELGLIDSKFEQAALKCLDSVKGTLANVPAAPASPAASPSPAPGATAASPASAKTPTAPTASNAETPAAEPAGPEALVPVPVTSMTVPQPNNETEQPSWKSFAALVVGGLTLPLAYFGRHALPLAKLTRASLPAPRQQA
jgi:hypothetical protein